MLEEPSASTSLPVPSTVLPHTVQIAAPFQPKNYQFPKRKMGSQLRAFLPKWFNEFPWLHYLDGKDHVICYICANQSQKSNLQSCRNKEQTFISQGFNNWKSAVEKFRQHQESKSHKTALTYEFIVQKFGDALAMANEAAKTLMQTNRHCFLKIIQCLRFLGRQGIAFQGNTGDESNFMQLLKLRSIDDPKLGQWLERKQDTYASHDIQNELLRIMSHHVIRELVSEIRPNFFSLVCDEYTDISNREQLTFCIRWVDGKLDSHEEFLGFYNIPNTGSNTVVSAIKDALIRLQLSLDSCRGQCYDGASNMLGLKSGIAKQICDIHPKAHATHCHAHSLSLCVKNTTSSCKTLSNAMDIAREIVALVKYSPKREKVLGDIKENVEQNSDDYDKKAGLSKLSATRWTVRALCFQRILDNYDSLMMLWQECLEGKLDPDVKARIIGCETQMKQFHFFFGLNLGQRLFCHTDNLSKTLQGSKMSAISGQRLANLTKKVLQELRNEQCFKLFYENVSKRAKNHEFIDEPSLSRKRRRPARYEEGTGEPTFPETAEDEFRRIYFEALDLIVHSIDLRFSQPSFKAYEKLESLLLKALVSSDFEDEFNYLKQHYDGDVDSFTLLSQLRLLPVIFKEDISNIVCFDDFLQKVKQLPPAESSLIGNVLTVCKLLHVNPATSATGERSFSMYPNIDHGEGVSACREALE